MGEASALSCTYKQKEVIHSKNVTTSWSSTAITHRLGQIISWLPHQLTTKPHFYCVPTVFLYVFVEFVELTWHIRHDPKCENRWNFFFNPIFCHELHEIPTMDIFGSGFAENLYMVRKKSERSFLLGFLCETFPKWLFPAKVTVLSTEIFSFFEWTEGELKKTKNFSAKHCHWAGKSHLGNVKHRKRQRKH